MPDLKESWNEVEKDLTNAFCNLGKTVIKSAKVGIDKLDKWANASDYQDKNKNIKNEHKKTNLNN